MARFRFRNLAKYVKEARQEKGFSQADLSMYLEVTTQTVSNFERGVSKLPTKHFRRAATVLGLDLSVMIEKYVADEAARLHHYL